MSDRSLYAAAGLAQIPHILGLVDRNRLSPTYGCFDRSYWHYRTAPFPSGMYQEFVLPLALVHRYEFPGGEAYHLQPRLKELTAAGIAYAARSAHPDGSCDDYFPYERALGAAAFSLYACTEGYILAGLQDQDLQGFFHRRAGWLLNRQESGRLSNHHALVVLALYNTYRVTNDTRYLEGAGKRLEMLLDWQTDEGWFPEYEGCDPGYLTATIDFLAKYHQKSRDGRVTKPLEKAARFAAHFMHPDGSYGGEYGSRNTALFFPHGFELLARRMPEARRVASLYMEGLRRDRRVHLDDDRMCAHLTYNHLQAYVDWWEGPREPPRAPAPLERYWPGARLYLRRDDRRYLVASAAKGGVLRLYVDGELACMDSGLVARLSNGRVLVSHFIDRYEVKRLEDGIQVEGNFGRRRFRLPTPVAQAVFHVGMCVLGRWASDWIRWLLQRLLIVGKKSVPLKFRRTVRMGDAVRLTDEIWTETGSVSLHQVDALYAGTDHTSIYVAMSNSFHRGCLEPWTDYGSILEPLNAQGYGRVDRIIG